MPVLNVGLIVVPFVLSLTSIGRFTLNHFLFEILPMVPGKKFLLFFRALLREKKYLIKFIDNFFKWIYHTFVEHPVTDEVILFLEQIFSIEGDPVTIMSDNGVQFVSNKMVNFLKKLGVCHGKAPLYSPRANGQVERANRFIKEGIQAALESKIDVFEFLKQKIWSYHITLNACTGVSPYFLMRGRQARSVLTPYFTKTCQETDLQSCISKVRNNIAESCICGKSDHDLSHSTRSKKVEVGDWVRVIKPSLNCKGSSIFTLPFKVERVSESADLLKDKGWWNKSSIVVLKPGQEFSF